MQKKEGSEYVLKYNSIYAWKEQFNAELKEKCLKVEMHNKDKDETKMIINNIEGFLNEKMVRRRRL